MRHNETLKMSIPGQLLVLFVNACMPS